MTCKCPTYSDLEFDRKSIDKRIAATKDIKRPLQLIAKSPSGNALFKCEGCQQLWQSSYAWNWGDKEYLFKVPNIVIADWMEECFAQPDQLLIHSGMMHDYNAKNTFVVSDIRCKKEDCVNNALVNNVLCKEHFIQSLQQFGMLPKPPKGRMFSPYI